MGMNDIDDSRGESENTLAGIGTCFVAERTGLLWALSYAVMTDGGLHIPSGRRRAGTEQGHRNSPG